MIRWSQSLVGALALAAPDFGFAKPIAFADGMTVMAEYGAGTMKEIQIFCAGAQADYETRRVSPPRPPPRRPSG